jgi:hypothetical protein
VHSAKTWLIVLLAFTTLGGAILAWRQRNEIAGLRAAAMPRDERADFQKRVWDLEKANRELKAQSPASSVAKTESGTPSGAPPSTTRREPDQQFDAMLGLLAQPDVPAKVALLQKSAVESRYAALFKNLNLPPAQIEKLKALLTERTLSLQDVLTVARDQGIDPRDNPAALRQLVMNAQNEINASLKSLLGEQGFTQLSVYEQTLPQRGVVNELQQRLSYTAAPLTPTQAELLIQVLAANPASRADVSPTATPTPRVGTAISTLFSGGSGVGGAVAAYQIDASRGPTITPAAVAQTQGFLSAPQVAALQQLQQQQQAQQQLRQRITETLQPLAATGTGKK